VSRVMPLMRLTNDSALTQMDVGKLSVGVVELHLDGARRLCPATSDLSQRVFKPVRKVNACTMLLARNWIDDRLATAFGNSRYDQLRLSLIHIDLKIDWSKDRVVQFLQRCGEHLKYRCPGFGVLAAHNAEQ